MICVESRTRKNIKKGDFTAMKVKYEDRLKQKMLVITTDTLVVGVDIAKRYHWARFVDYRGFEQSNALKFENNSNGFKTILTRIKEICKQEKLSIV